MSKTELRHVIPVILEDEGLRNSQLYEFKNERVVAMKLTNGAPCSTHGELFAKWPGPEADITQWFMLENGYAVGKCSDVQSRKFPIFKLT